MSEIYNFYIEKNNETTNEIVIRPEYPIICNDKERLSIKLLDFKHLNSIYNVSSTLHNNVISINNFIPQYTQLETFTVANALPENIYLHNIATDENSEFSSFTRSYDVPTKVETIQSTSGNSAYRFYYYDVNNVSTNPYLQRSNFRSDYYDPNYYIKFDKDNSWIMIEKIVTTPEINTFKLEEIIIMMRFVSGVNNYTAPVNITFGMSAWNDINGQEFTLAPYDNVISFDVGETVRTTSMKINNTVPFKYYKFYITSTNIQLNIGQVQLQLFNSYRTLYEYVTYPAVNSLKALSITDGFYNINDLITAINTKSALITAKISVAKQDFTNKIIFSRSLPIIAGETMSVSFTNKATQDMFGFSSLSFDLGETQVIGDKYCNIMNFSKIIISTNLDFTTKTYNYISNNSSIYTKGIGNILEWIDTDIAPMSCINYKNIENTSHKLNNKYINEFKILFCTEKSLPIVLDNYLMHLQVIKYKK